MWCRASRQLDGLGECGGGPERLTEPVRHRLLRQEDQLAAGHRVQHVDVRLTDAFLLAPQRLFRPAHLGHVKGGERPQVPPDGKGEQQLVGVVRRYVKLRPRGTLAAHGAGSELEVRAHPLVQGIAVAHVPAHGQLASDVLPHRLRRVHVVDHEVLRLPLPVADDAEHRQALGAVLEQPQVALLRGAEAVQPASREQPEDEAGDGHEEQSLHRGDLALDGDGQVERPEDAVGEDDPQRRGNHVDEREPQGKAARRRPRLGAPPAPAARHALLLTLWRCLRRHDRSSVRTA